MCFDLLSSVCWLMLAVAAVAAPGAGVVVACMSASVCSTEAGKLEGPGTAVVVACMSADVCSTEASKSGI